MTEAQVWVALAVGVTTLIGGFLAWRRRIRPGYLKKRAKMIGAWHSIFGRDEIVDETTGNLLVPALPGIGVRVALTEEHLGEMARAMTQVADAMLRVEAHDRHLAVHDGDIAELKDDVQTLKAASVERVVSGVERVTLYRTMEEAIKATPDVVVEPDRPDPPQ